ncbi:MAG: class I SAM-dependent methyltransferase [Actinomycetota bacterium]|nr:class I SAM-dependent methyltransferase [Actinomycetota bacterium]
MSLSEHWERHAADWTRWAREPGHDSYWRFHRDSFLELLPPPGRLTLDVGCGEGRLARDLKERGHNVRAFDASPALVEAAREAEPLLEVTQADAGALPVEDGASDLVVSFMVLMNLDDLEGVVHEAARVLDPGGHFCVAITHPINTAGKFETREPDSAFVITESYFEAHRNDLRAERDGLTMTFVDLHRPLQDYAEALERAGFAIQRIREIGDEEEPPQRESQLRWRRVPLFLHVRAAKS